MVKATRKVQGGKKKSVPKKYAKPLSLSHMSLTDAVDMLLATPPKKKTTKRKS